jgi:hypothetical protein
MVNARTCAHIAAKRYKKFRKERGMGVRGKGEGKALFKGFPFPLPPAAGGPISPRLASGREDG